MARREEFKARDNQNSSGDLDAELERLAALSQVQYEHERKGAAKRLNVRASILDRLVEAKRPTTDDGKQGKIERYTARADQAGLARSAIAKLPDDGSY